MNTIGAQCQPQTAKCQISPQIRCAPDLPRSGKEAAQVASRPLRPVQSTVIISVVSKVKHIAFTIPLRAGEDLADQME